MTPRAFSKGEAIRFGWETAKRNFWFFFLIYCVYFVVAFVPPRLVPPGRTPFEILLTLGISIAVGVLSIVTALGLVRVGLRFTDNEKPSVADLFSANFGQVLSFFVAFILSAIVTGIGFVLLVIPGIILGIRLSLVTYVIVDKKLGPVAALRESWELTRGSAWNLSLFSILLLLINALGALALVIGLLWTGPTSLVANAFVYRKLQAARGARAAAPILG